MRDVVVDHGFQLRHPVVGVEGKNAFGVVLLLLLARSRRGETVRA